MCLRPMLCDSANAAKPIPLFYLYNAAKAAMAVIYPVCLWQMLYDNSNAGKAFPTSMMPI